MPDTTEIKRQTAYKCNIASLSKGVFVRRPGWESNFVMTEYGDFSRINIIAVVVDKDENSLTLDDNTGKISGRMFENPERLDAIDIGDLVLVIGRPREFNNQMYLTLEIVRKIDKDWINYRRKELSLIKKLRDVDTVKNVKLAQPEIVESQSTMSSKERILNIIKQLDTGSGASIDDIIMISKISNAEEIIQDMMLKGEIFELKPGKLKLI